MGNDIVSLLICLLNICLSSFVLDHLNICPLFLLLIDFWEFLYILFVRYMHCKMNIFSQNMTCLFTSFTFIMVVIPAIFSVCMCEKKSVRVKGQRKR